MLAVIHYSLPWDHHPLMRLATVCGIVLAENGIRSTLAITPPRHHSPRRPQHHVHCICYLLCGATFNAAAAAVLLLPLLSLDIIDNDQSRKVQQQ